MNTWDKIEYNKITGWGLNNPDSEVFALFAISDEVVGCEKRACPCFSHSPAERFYELIPHNGWRIVQRRRDKRDENTTWEFIKLVSGQRTKYFVKISKEGFWDYVEEM